MVQQVALRFVDDRWLRSHARVRQRVDGRVIDELLHVRRVHEAVNQLPDTAHQQVLVDRHDEDLLRRNRWDEQRAQKAKAKATG